MSKILLATSSHRFAQHLRESIDQEVLAVPLSAAAEKTLELSKSPGPRTLVLDADANPADALSLAARCRAFGISVILVSAQPETLALSAIRAGVVDVMNTNADPNSLREVCHRAERHSLEMQSLNAPSQTSGHQQRVITVASPKGGVGKTTVATNISVGLARRHGPSVGLIDLDIHFGDVASALNLDPRYTLPDAANSAAASDGMALKTMTTVHPSGLFVVPGADSPAMADAITPDQITGLLNTLATAFDVVVIDTAPGLGEHTLSVLDVTTDLVLVTSLDVPGVRGLRKELETLQALRLLPASTTIVMNFCDPGRGLRIKDVEETIGRPIDIELPPDKEVPLSVNEGVPVLASGRRSQFGKRLNKLVDRFFAETQAGMGIPAAQDAKRASRRAW